MIEPIGGTFDRYVPRKSRLVGGDESARNEIMILIAGMPRPECFWDARGTSLKQWYFI